VPIKPKFRDTFPKNLWLGITIDGTSNYWKYPLASLQNSSAVVKFISFEPVLGCHFPQDLSLIDWAIIGAQTGAGAKAVNQEHVNGLINIIKSYKVPMFVKSNIQTQLEHSGFDWIDRREFPKMKPVDNTNDVTCVDFWI
jgi:protein gp37